MCWLSFLSDETWCFLGHEQPTDLLLYRTKISMYGEGNHSADRHMGKALKFLLQLLKLLLIKWINQLNHATSSRRGCVTVRGCWSGCRIRKSAACDSHAQCWLITVVTDSLHRHFPHTHHTDRQASAKPSWPHSTWTLWHHNSEKSIDQHADSAAGSHHKLKRHTTFLLFASENRYALRLSPLYWWRWTNREIRGSDLWPGL